MITIGIPVELQNVVEGVGCLGSMNLIHSFYMSDKHEDASFSDRLTLLEKEFPGAAILCHKIGLMPKVGVLSSPQRTKY